MVLRENSNLQLIKSNNFHPNLKHVCLFFEFTTNQQKVKRTDLKKCQYFWSPINAKHMFLHSLNAQANICQMKVDKKW